MTKKNILIFTLILALAGLSLYLNRGWFQTVPLQISHRSMAPRGAAARNRNSKAAANPVIFLLNKKIQLTSVEVIPVSDIQTNKYPHAIWNLVSDSNSVPLKTFNYGTPIRGMRPSIKGANPEPLEPGVNYRVRIKAGSLSAEHDFAPVPRVP